MQVKPQSAAANFTALHVANAGDLKLLKISSILDKKYLKTLPDKVDIKKLMPKLTPQDASRWQEMVEYAVDMAQEPYNVTYLETFQNKPCGIITYWVNNKTINLDCICTWPIETGKKIYLAGKILFYQLFKDFSSEKCNKIELEAITNGPADTVKKYSELGFKKTSRVFPTKVVMEAKQDGIKQAFNKLKPLIDYFETEGEKIDLFKYLD